MSFCTDYYWLDVAKDLAASGVQITHLISRPPDVQLAAKQALPNTTIINQDLLEYPKYVEQINQTNPVTLSQKLLDEFRESELEFLAITDRLAFFPLTVKRRRAIFHDLIKYWLHFLQTHQLDAIFLTDTPHVGFDTALFAVATHLKIPIISARRPFIRDRMLLVTDYRQYLPKVPAAYLQKLDKTRLLKKVGQELLDDVFLENAWQKKDAHFSQVIHQKRSNHFSFQQLNPLRIIQYGLSLFAPSNYGGFNYNNNTLKLIEKICGVYHRYHNHRRRQYYDRLASQSKVSLTTKYIYFPLHLQPERSTTPEGGMFENQFLALEILEKSLPPKWKIIVKEHPRQFGRFDFQKHTYRSRTFYSQIAAMPKVVLCPMTIPQEILVRNAQLTATITGTGGWESLKINKPALVFGNTWYSPCRSCFVVQSLEESKLAIQEAKTKAKDEVELDVLRFLAYYQKRLIVASNAREFAKTSPRNYDDLVHTMSMAIQKML